MAETINVSVVEDEVSVTAQEDQATAEAESAVVYSGSQPVEDVAWDDVTGKPETFPPESHAHTADEVSGLANVATSGSYNDLSDQPTIPTLDGYATEEYVGEAIANAQLSGGEVDLSAYATKQYVDESIAAIPSTDLSDYATKQYVDESIPDLTGYATKQYVDDSIPDLEGYATETYVTEAIAEAQLSGESVDLSSYATKSYVDTAVNGRAKRRNISVSSNASYAVGGVFEVSEDVTGKHPVFASIKYLPAMGRVSGSTGSKTITFSISTPYGSGVEIDTIKFDVSDDCLTWTVAETQIMRITTTGSSVSTDVSMTFGEVVLIN